MTLFRLFSVVAMATPPGTRDQNGSQFFCTFDACEWLNGKHTIFGKVTGETIFNLLSMQELETDANDRPENPPKICSVDVLLSPFDDIVPREKKPISAPVVKTKKTKKKNATLLSFADDEGSELDAAQITMASSHDLVDDDPHLSRSVKNIDDNHQMVKKRSTEDVSVVSPPDSSSNRVRNAPESAVTVPTLNDDEAELARLRDQVKSMKSKAFHVEKRKKELDQNSVLTPLEQRRQAYLKNRTTSRKEREQDTLQKLESFKSTLQSQADKPTLKPAESLADDDDPEWLKHSLAFAKRPQDFDPMAADVQNYEYILTDPLAEQAGKKRRRSPPLK